MVTQLANYFPWQLESDWKQGSRDYGAFNFYRVNEQCNTNMIMEPLDELRIKVAKWLYN